MKRNRCTYGTPLFPLFFRVSSLDLQTPSGSAEGPSAKRTPQQSKGGGSLGRMKAKVGWRKLLRLVGGKLERDPARLPGLNAICLSDLLFGNEDGESDRTSQSRVSRQDLSDRDNILASPRRHLEAVSIEPDVSANAAND